MVGIELNDCHVPRLSTETVDLAPVPEHGDRLQRFARREILTARNTCFAPTPSPSVGLTESARLAAARMP
jgi:hypothetical protein